jgi:predicted nucleic acid-binding protein
MKRWDFSPSLLCGHADMIFEPSLSSWGQIYADEVAPAEHVRTASVRILRVHDLRAADSLQLAAALIWINHDPSGAGFVCLDKRLREAAAKEGFDVHPLE